MKKSPILFIVFNRPELTRRVFEMIRIARPDILYISCDAPRRAKGQVEYEKVEEVKKIIHLIDWPCTVQYKIAKENLGCGKSVSEAIEWAFTHEDRLIILEDDCVPHADFFTYCDELLERYKDDQRIGCIDGTSLLTSINPTKLDSYEYSYYFSRIHCVWGWATWKRVWQNYSFDLADWPKIKKQRLLEHYWSTQRNYEHTVAHLEMILDGRVDSWDFQLVASLALQNQLIIHPKQNLVENIGAGRDAHHNKIVTKLNNIKTHQLEWPLTHPPYVANHSYFDYLIEKSYTQHKVFIKIKSLLFPLVKKILS
ncbi:MAG: hypothetical protein WCO78_04380 [Candidatus Roizmanbacteria bacterium]